MLDKAFGRVLAARRHEIGWTQDDLARRTQLQRGYISLLERGAKSPSLHTMGILAAALGTSVSALLAQAEADIREAQAIVVFIYALADPLTQAVHYVGQSRQPRQRYNGHLSEARATDDESEAPSGPSKTAWLKALLAQNLKPALRILEESNAAEATHREAYWIVEMLKQGQPLTNQSIDWRQIRALGYNPAANVLQRSLFDVLPQELGK